MLTVFANKKKKKNPEVSDFQFSQKSDRLKGKFGFLISLFNGISTFVRYLMPNPSQLKNHGGTI